MKTFEIIDNSKVVATCTIPANLITSPESFDSYAMLFQERLNELRLKYNTITTTQIDEKSYIIKAILKDTILNEKD